MNIHEYQAKAVLKEFGAPVPRGFPAFTPDEAVDAAAKPEARAGRKPATAAVATAANPGAAVPARTRAPA